MIKRQRTVGLITFLKGSTDPAVGIPGCANYDHHYGGCLFADTCKVQEGQRCSYFEKAVLSTAADIGQKEPVYSLYARQVGIEKNCQLDTGEIRRCPECETAELRNRQRYCDDCSRKRRRQSYRNSRSKRNS